MNREELVAVQLVAPTFFSDMAEKQQQEKKQKKEKRPKAASSKHGIPGVKLEGQLIDVRDCEHATLHCLASEKACSEFQLRLTLREPLGSGGECKNSTPVFSLPGITLVLSLFVQGESLAV